MPHTEPIPVIPDGHCIARVTGALFITTGAVPYSIPARSGPIFHFPLFLMAKRSTHATKLLYSMRLTSVDPVISVIPPDDHFHGTHKISSGPKNSRMKRVQR